MKKLKRSRGSSKFTTTLSDIPEEILIDIFSRMSITTIVTCRCVTKTWNKLLLPSNSQFTQLHFKRSHVQFILETCNDSKFLFHFVELENDTNLNSIRLFPSRFRLSRCNWIAVNSCNGFLLLGTGKNHLNPVKICNPITGEYFNLPIRKKDGFIQTTVVSGFGFSVKSNEYKVVRLVRRNEGYMRMVEVFTIGTNSWRSIGTTPNNISSLMRSINNKAYDTTFFNGVIHWVFDVWFTSDFIVSFDLESETFGIVPPPPHLSTLPISRRYTIRIGVLGEFLYLSHNTDLWVMKEYGVQESWTKVCVFHGLRVETCQALKYLNDGKIFVNYNHKKLISYDPVRKNSKEFKIPQCCSMLGTIAHVPSFVSFNDAMMGDKGAELRTRMCQVRVEERD